MLRDEGDDIKAAICCPHFTSSSTEYGDQAMQRLRRGCLVLHPCDPDVVRAGLAPVGLFAREITSRHDAHAGLFPEPLRHHFAAALFCNIEPEEKPAGRAFVTVAIADDLIG